jgi:hypothetical protein
MRSAVLLGSGGAGGVTGTMGRTMAGEMVATGRTPEARAGGATTGVSERGNEGEGARGTVDRAVLTGPLQKGLGPKAEQKDDARTETFQCNGRAEHKKRRGAFLTSTNRPGSVAKDPEIQAEHPSGVAAGSREGWSH